MVDCAAQAAGQVEAVKRMGVRQPTVSGFEKEPSDPNGLRCKRYACALTPGSRSSSCRFAVPVRASALLLLRPTGPHRSGCGCRQGNPDADELGSHISVRQAEVA